jgi:uncharacterized membrane protein YfcA
VRLVAIGLVAGVFSALFGVGGGIVAVPLLIILVHLPERVATATSLGAIGITALAGTIFFAVRGDVEVGYAALVGIPAAAAAAHRRELAELPLRRAARGRCTLAAARVSATTIALALALGLAAGVLAGMFGLGGGLLFVPTLLALGLGQLEAQATSLLAILPAVAAGAWNQRRYGNLRVRTAFALGAASIAGVLVGAWIAISLPESALRRLFALLLLVVAARLAWRAARPAPRYPQAT